MIWRPFFARVNVNHTSIYSRILVKVCAVDMSTGLVKKTSLTRKQISSRVDTVLSWGLIVYKLGASCLKFGGEFVWPLPKRQQLKKVSIDCLTIGAEKILVTEKPVKKLGVWLDSKLSMDAHITKTCSAAFYYLYNVRRIRRYLSRECAESLIHAFISTRLDYCNSVLQYSIIPIRKTAENSKLCRKTHLKRKQILPYHSTSYECALAAS